MAFWLFALLLLVVRARVFLQFNSLYIDTDQPNLWLAAKDFAKGMFYEPRYYGQSYNTCMESLFALPLMAMNVPVYYAVPIATHIIFLFPVFFTAFFLYAQKRIWHATLVLALFLCFPTSFDLLTSLPRGFITGLFFNSFFVVSVMYPQRLPMLGINTFLAVLGYFVNQSAILVSAPFLFYIFLHNYRRPGYYTITFLALLSYIPFYFLFDRFYENHPDYVVHEVYFETKLKYFMQSFDNLDQRFAHVSPFVENNCFSLLVLIGLAGVLLWQSSKKGFAAFVLFLLILLVSFANLRTTDGSTWIFFSLSRVYLGIPMALSLFLCLQPIEKPKPWGLPLLAIPLIFTAWKSYTFEKDMTRNLRLYDWFHITAMKLDDVISDVNDFKNICRQHKANALFVSNSFWQHTILAYAAPALDKHFPRTELINGDRRYWVRNESPEKVFPRFLLVSGYGDLEKWVQPTDSFHLEPIDHQCIYLVRANRLSKHRFLHRFRQLEKMSSGN